MSQPGTKTYRPVKVSKAAYAGAAGYVGVVISWIFVYESLYLWLQSAYVRYVLIQQVGGVIALCISIAYATTAWHVVDSFYKSRKETVDQYPHKLSILLSEDGKFAEGNMLVSEDGIIPFAIYNRDLQVISKVGDQRSRSPAITQLLQAADTRPIGDTVDKELMEKISENEKPILKPVVPAQPPPVTKTTTGQGPQVTQQIAAPSPGITVEAPLELATSPTDLNPAFIGYMIIPNPEFELFDVLVITIPVSFARLMGAFLLKEFPYKGLLVFRPVAPLALVKIHRLFDKDNRSILVAEVGWSAYHAEMIAINLKVASISNVDLVDVPIPVMDPKTNTVVMTKVKMPAGAAIFTALSNWETPKLRETIASRDSTIDALNQRKFSTIDQAGRMATEDQTLFEKATGGKGGGIHLMRSIRQHKKASFLVGTLLVLTFLTVLLGLAGYKV